MLLNLNSVNSDYQELTKEYILSKVSPIEITEYYLNINLKYSTLISSPFRKDTNPSFGIKIIDNNNILAKDFAKGESFDCFGLVSKLFNTNFPETLRIIANDFGLYKHNYKDISSKDILEYDKDIIINNDYNLKHKISIVDQNFTKVDVDYWNNYFIPISTLVEYDVFSCKYVWFNGQIVRKYSNSNPVYAYKYTNYKSYSYKIYCPLTKNPRQKWLFNGTKDDIEGFDQLPLFGNLLIITKSLKDIMCLKNFGYNAISLQGEGNKLELSTYLKLKKRFNNIISFYDNDKAGLEGANYLKSNYNIKSIYIPLENEVKDFSDYCYSHSYEESKELIDKLVNENK